MWHFENSTMVGGLRDFNLKNDDKSEYLGTLFGAKVEHKNL